jgi:hypothetical protein
MRDLPNQKKLLLLLRYGCWKEGLRLSLRLPMRSSFRKGGAYPQTNGNHWRGSTQLQRDEWTGNHSPSDPT